MTARRALALAATGALVLVQTAAPAAAVNPPPADERRLPAPGPAAPGQPTAQHDDCATPPEAAAATPGQLAGLDLPTVWALTRGAGQTVAVIDTGVARHRRLPHLVPGGDYVSHHDGTFDCDGHGTIVAGIIGATPDVENPDAFSGIAPDVTVLAIRQSSNKFHGIDDPGGSGVGDVETLAAAVRLAADRGATVINISTVACVPADVGIDDAALGAALSYAVDVKNVVVVVAAGNVGGPGQCPDHNPRTATDAEEVVSVASPAWYDDYVLTVGSVGSDGAASEFSLAGPWVDVAAPGEDVVSLAPADDGLIDVTASGAPISGTSYAVAVVSAVAALVRARSPELTARQVMQRLEDTAHHPPAGWDPVVGHGVVDALAAVSGPGSDRPGPVAATPILTVAEPQDSAASSHRTAVRGAVVCLALICCVALASAAVRRLRSRTAPGA